MKIVPFKAWHLDEIELQGPQMYLRGWLTEDQKQRLEHYPSYTALLDGKPVAMAGVIETWPGRALAWAYLSEMGPRQFVLVHRSVSRFLEACYTKRVEMTVDCDFPQAHRWAKMLGFKMEAERMVAYTPNGQDCALYARIL